jgi:hypothetical protein
LEFSQWGGHQASHRETRSPRPGAQECCWQAKRALAESPAVSYDIHLLRFVDGEPEPRRAGRVHELLERAADAPPDEHGYSRVSWKGGEADLYGMTESPEDAVESMMFSRPAGDDHIFDLIYQVACAGEMAVLLQDGVVCLADPRHKAHLPEDVQEWPRHHIDSGQALAAVIRRP